ncbi:MAG: transporter family-2 protein [Candidatus Promineifilaceae bacterium]|jgi:transporter family-2 protein
MIPFLINLLIGIIGGIAAGLQAPLSGLMGQKVGELGSVFITYGLGAIAILVIVIGASFFGLADFSQWREIPWWAFLSGPIGLIIIGSISYSVPKLGASNATMLFLIGWLVFSAVTDHFGWFEVPIKPFNLSRIAGSFTLVLGGWLILR